MQIKSVLEQISSEVFSMKDLNQAKQFTTQFLEGKSINEEDKKLLTAAVNESKSLVKFQQYLCNALLKYEGMGMNRLQKNKSEKPVAGEGCE